MSTTENNNDIKITPNDDEFENVKLNTWQSIKKFLTELFDIRSDSDRDATIEAVKKDISFKGHTAWILIFSIFVASIGLNVSSTAVVIGAMLISPLMGPIVGIGLSVAINDVDTLKRSLINLGVMVFLSVLTAFLYFKLSPLTEETPELIARTYPTILDVLIAIFGGLGLIVAKTKSGTIASVIFGVAIATALMPPLCTVGYGLAIGNASYAGGALYLFSINAVFIALATFIVSKILQFPLVRYANSKRRKRTAQIATAIAIAVMVPSVWLFIKLLEEQVFENKTKDFVKNIIKYEGAEVVKFTQDYKKKNIDVYLIGRPVPQNKINDWLKELSETESLEQTRLRIYQGADQSGEMAAKLSGEIKAGILEDLYVKNEQIIQDKDEKIRFLENEVALLKIQNVPFQQLSEEIKINYDNVETFSYSNKITTDFKKTDTLPVINIRWKKNVPSRERRADLKKIEAWLKYKMKLDTLQVSEYP
ncbi:DUF389 domain-containing protein [Aequorivita vladivostokensis]|uniref:Membrane protein n=1 Tax=Aequorivita vladivostokensis TaxID=171194 RepID=A0ABR5DG33_9FLAO|nr:DUF389 domain-containing protein [Aequorivita vladivostokensis]KJJ37757.1 membrane protein [Aequorivita vladivostokensis]MAB56938.1 DUF389 domain-containing protein [Aequorivita sp.]MBF31290.1 DUF389 domain-containing protein [Aequorivita sp.]|tara:strand:+ start:31683 stop:33119 length:1437 start_codon:yes stop_codon:yes gene_type:complete